MRPGGRPIFRPFPIGVITFMAGRASGRNTRSALTLVIWNRHAVTAFREIGAALNNHRCTERCHKARAGRLAAQGSRYWSAVK
jgi:hypothetical protein